MTRAECTHPDFVADVEVHRVEDGGVVRHFVAELKVRCTMCSLPFHFVGTPTGLSFSRPTVDLPATTLHAPMVPGVRIEIPAQIRFEVA